jgi:CheY-like chemotaxis protein
MVLLQDGDSLLDFMGSVRRGSTPMPALILLDINMPGMNGFDVLRQIKKLEEFRELPAIVMFTASNEDSDRVKAQSLGADGYWTKPYGIDAYVQFFSQI